MSTSLSLLCAKVKLLRAKKQQWKIDIFLFLWQVYAGYGKLVFFLRNQWTSLWAYHNELFRARCVDVDVLLWHRADTSRQQCLALTHGPGVHLHSHSRLRKRRMFHHTTYALLVPSRNSYVGCSRDHDYLFLCRRGIHIDHSSATDSVAWHS